MINPASSSAIIRLASNPCPPSSCSPCEFPGLIGRDGEGVVRPLFGRVG